MQDASLIKIRGQFQYAASSRVDAASLSLDLENDQLTVYDRASGEVVHCLRYSDCTMSPRLPSIPMVLYFGDGASFTPESSEYCWPKSHPSSSWIYWLEKKWHYGAIAVVLMLAFLFAMIKVAIPFAAVQIAKVIPTYISQEMGEQSLVALDRLYFEESELSTDIKMKIAANWDALLEQFNLPKERYQLKFRDWDLGPNALALADGTVVVTDGLVELMQDDLHLLDAILLHEIGHVEHHHNLEAAIRATITTVLYSVIFGDIEGVGEVVLGAGISLVDLSFSREMEEQADQFAYQHLLDMGRPAEDFANALRKLGTVYPDAEDEEDNLWRYLQSHPDIEERIKARPQQ